VAGSVLMLGAVGQLQFEVVAHRLEHEYGCKARIQPCRFQHRPLGDLRRRRRRARAQPLHRSQRPPHGLRRGERAHASWWSTRPSCAPSRSNWPKIKFHALREHAGLVFPEANRR
jgi:peptide chain release factor 3